MNNSNSEDDLKTKAGKLKNAHNDIVGNLTILLPDPKDSGFDLDMGWRDTLQKEQWCKTLVEYNTNENKRIFELESAINNLKSEPDKPAKLLEFIKEDIELLNDMLGLKKLGEKMIIDFDC